MTRAALNFDGPALEPADIERLGKQSRAVFDLMCDGGWRTLRAISEAVTCSESSASERLRDFRKDRFGAHTVNRRKIAEGLFEYQLVVKK